MVSETPDNRTEALRYMTFYGVFHFLLEISLLKSLNTSLGFPAKQPGCEGPKKVDNN